MPLLDKNDLEFDGVGDLFAGARQLPEYTEATRAGNGWSCRTATLFAPDAAYPATTAALEIWNQTTSCMVMIVDTLFAVQILSTAATQTYAIFAQVYTKAAPTLTALSVYSASGRNPYTTTVGTRVVTGVGTTVIANGWRPWGNPQAWGTGAATPGNAWSAEINGRLIVPPGASLQIAVAGSLATASTFQAGASWYEAPLKAAT